MTVMIFPPVCDEQTQTAALYCWEKPHQDLDGVCDNDKCALHSDGTFKAGVKFCQIWFLKTLGRLKIQQGQLDPGTF